MNAEERRDVKVAFESGWAIRRVRGPGVLMSTGLWQLGWLTVLVNLKKVMRLLWWVVRFVVILIVLWRYPAVLGWSIAYSDSGSLLTLVVYLMLRVVVVVCRIDLVLPIRDLHAIIVR